jgi:hypothetical protein
MLAAPRLMSEKVYVSGLTSLWPEITRILLVHPEVS